MADAGSTINLHVLKDYREDMGLGFLEVGSEYFVFAGNRKSHDFIQITDVFYSRYEPLPDRCYADNDAFYVFQEFSGRVEQHMGDKILRNRYIRQIDGVNELRSYYYSEETFDYYLEATAQKRAAKSEARRRLLADSRRLRHLFSSPKNGC